MLSCKVVTLYEFGFLAKDPQAKNLPQVKVISRAAYDYLKNLCLSEQVERRLLSLRCFQGMEVLQVQNYAGVIFTPDRTQIEVLPKVGKGFNDDELGQAKARASLISMLKALRGFEHIQTSSANISVQRMPLLEVFIAQFLQSVNTLVKRGLRSDYVRREDNLTFLKGKMQTKQQLQRNFIQKQRFYCEYDEFLLDRPANRVVKAALKRVESLIRSQSNHKLLNELLFAFHEVPSSSNWQQDIALLKLDRGMGHYQNPLAWSRLILEGYSPQTMKGNHHAFSLLFPMEKVFEDFVGKTLQRHLQQCHSSYTLVSQAEEHFLASYQARGKFKLKPDMLIKKEGVNQMVLDTKWKLLDGQITNSNIAQSDVYQLFAYAKRYLVAEKTGKDVVLVYPSQENFSMPLPHPFELGEGHKLWIIPFTIDNHASHFVANGLLDLLS